MTTGLDVEGADPPAVVPGGADVRPEGVELFPRVPTDHEEQDEELLHVGAWRNRDARLDEGDRVRRETHSYGTEGAGDGIQAPGSIP